MTDPRRGIVARPLAGGTLGAGAEATFVVEEAIDDGSMPGYPLAPLHRHLDEDEVWYVLQGRLIVRVGDEALEIGPGEAVLGPRGVPHTFLNPSSEPARYLLVTGPRTAGLLRSLHDGIATESEALSALFAAHGVELLG